MKRLFSICLLMLCLSFPVFAGHTVAGDKCDDGTAGCIPDGNSSQQVAPNDLGSEVMLILALLALLSKFKA